MGDILDKLQKSVELTSGIGSGNKLVVKLMEELSKSAKEWLFKDIKQSNDLLAYVDQLPDAEIVNALLAGVKLKIEYAPTPRLEISYDDIFGTWYSESLTEDHVATITDMLQKSFCKWIDSPEPGIVAEKVFTASFGEIWR